MKRFILLVLSIFLSACLIAKSNLKFSHFSTKDGLSNSWIRAIHQDNLGFLWLGTDDGLNRFDGLSFQTYRPINKDHFDVGNFRVNDIIAKDSCHLWICTDSGLYLFDQISETFQLDTLIVPHPVLSAVNDSVNFWFATNNGLYQYRVKPVQIKHLSNSNKNNTIFTNNYINTLFVDHNKLLWIGTKGGLSVYSTKINQAIQLNDQLHELKTYDIVAIHEDLFGQIWIGTAQNGLFRIQIENNIVQVDKIVQGNITSITTVDKNQLWFSTSLEFGLGIIHLDSLRSGTLSITTETHDQLDENSLSNNSIFTIFANKMGDVWMGTFGQGLNYYNTHQLPFKNISSIAKHIKLSSNLVNTLLEDNDYLWIGTEEGLNKYHIATGKTTTYLHNITDTTTLASNTVISLFKDSKNRIWVGNWAGGLNLYLPELDAFKRYVPNGNPGSICSKHVFSIAEDDNGNLWIGTNGGGLHQFDVETEKFKQFIHHNDDAHSLDGKSINKLIFTKNKQLYISLYSTLDHYNFSDSTFDHFHLNGNPHKKYVSGSITDMFEDQKGQLWFATNLGLELFDPIQKSLRRYTTNDGLASNTIQSILEDNNGNLWLSTNKGLSKFVDGTLVPDDPQFINFSEDDGIPAFDFKTRSALKTKKGLFYFGSSNGCTYFHPDSIKINMIKPKVVLTNFSIQESQPNATIKYKPFKGNINFEKRIDLYYPNTDFTVGFAALNFLHPKKNHYKYQLEGYDTEWIDAGDIQYAPYTNLKAAKYLFKVMGTNNDGVWCEQPATLSIHVYPPWWNSLLFKIGIVLFVLFIGATVIITRFIDLKKEKELLKVLVEKRTTELSRLNTLLEEKQVKISEQNKSLEQHQNKLEDLVASRTKELEQAKKHAEESDKLKSSFLANMSHEIRTPLNAMIGFSTMLNQPELTKEKRKTYIRYIEENGKTLSVLINDIIDISVIEANQLKLKKERVNISKMMKDLLSFYEMGNQKGLSLELINAKESKGLYLLVDEFRFRQILVNLLNNAFKYTHTGKISFGFSQTDDEVIFFVRDTGIGIPKDDLPKIFEHFYKVEKEKSKLYRGTGIGLAICKKLVELMAGKIWVDSQLNEGSTFYFSLPK